MEKLIPARRCIIARAAVEALHLTPAHDALYPPHPHRSLAAPHTRAAAHAGSMAADATENEPRTPPRDRSQLEKVESAGKDSVEDDSDDDEEDAEDEEPKLKYSRLTSNLLPLYRNGDATSTFMVAGDKMVCWL